MRMCLSDRINSDGQGTCLQMCGPHHHVNMIASLGVQNPTFYIALFVATCAASILSAFTGSLVTVISIIMHERSTNEKSIFSLIVFDRYGVIHSITLFESLSWSICSMFFFLNNVLNVSAWCGATDIHAGGAFLKSARKFVCTLAIDVCNCACADWNQPHAMRNRYNMFARQATQTC